jgi:hypothetical protein
LFPQQQVTMTAEPMHPARGGTPSRGSRLRVARSWPLLLAAGALTTACHHDERATLSQSGAPHAQSSDAPLAQGVTAPPETLAILASPAKPLKEAGADQSPAVAPLAPPVIHTVD